MDVKRVVVVTLVVKETKTTTTKRTTPTLVYKTLDPLPCALPAATDFHANVSLMAESSSSSSSSNHYRNNPKYTMKGVVMEYLMHWHDWMIYYTRKICGVLVVVVARALGAMAATTASDTLY